jgi:2-desacetyl-2-hydroxyethyl bacteriochlorophyllide A dehydrogenase
MTLSNRVAFTGKQAVELQSHSLAGPAAGEVLVKTTWSLMSTGTENIVFNRNFAPGTHWDNWVKYPFFPGYCAVGSIIAVGEGVPASRVGENVAIRAGHAAHHLIKADEAYPIPAGIPLREATWFGLAKIAFMGARRAEYRAGDDVLVIGAGPIGQMSLRWAAACGAGRITTIDLEPARLALATAGGASQVLSSKPEESHDLLKAHHDGLLPRVVLDTTGHAPVFASALTTVRDFGRLILIGDTGKPQEQHLTPDVITRGLSVVGAHDCHNDAEWNNATITRLFFRLVGSGRFPLHGLVTDVFKPADCVAAYAAANARRGTTMGIVFDWN